MFEELLKGELIFYAVCGICIIHMIIKCVISLSYTHICRETVSMAPANGKFAARINEYFDNEYSRYGYIRNVELFVKSYMNRTKIAGFCVGSLRNIDALAVFLCIAVCMLGLVRSYMSGDNISDMLYYVMAAVISVGFIIFADILAGINYKKERIIMQICNYYENYAVPEKERGADAFKEKDICRISDEIDAGIAELAESMEAYEAEELKQNINKHKENGLNINLSNGEQKIFEEVINEYLT